MSEPRPLPFSWPDVKSRLQASVYTLLPALGIVDQARSGIVTPRNPTRVDRRVGSFVIWTKPTAAGAWCDYATGEKGDVFDLIVYLRGLQARIDAYWWALEWLGLDRGQVRAAGDAQAARARAEREAKAAAAREAAVTADKSSRLFRWWLSLPPIAGTVAETYLREARRIPMDRLQRAPGALRFAAALDHTDGATGEVTTWPAMVAAMTRGKTVTGLHRTWLAPDGSGKAPVATPKKMIGSVRGAAIRLSAGPSGLSPTAAAKAGRLDPLAIGEGIETCLTVAAARLDYRVWAAGSLGAMGQLDWPDCASAVVLLAEHDWSQQARDAFAAVAARWRSLAAGRPVEIAASRVGSDFNDWATAA